MSRYANSNPEQWGYMNGQGPTKWPAKRGYRADTIEPTETAQEWAGRIAGAAGAQECAVCGTLTFGRVHDQAMCAGCQDDMAAGA